MNRIKRYVLTKLISKVWNGITLTDLESEYNKLSVEKQATLALGASDLTQMPLWKFLNEEMQKVAIKKMYMAGTKDEIIFAQACLWMEQVRQEKVNNLAKISENKTK